MGSLAHFLDNLACLFLGGAHFKHVVSTVKRDEKHHEQDARIENKRYVKHSTGD